MSFAPPHQHRRRRRPADGPERRSREPLNLQIPSTDRKISLRSKVTTLFTVIGAVTVLVLAANTVAFAATGGKFFLGKSNFANKQSTLTRTTSGTTLKLNTKYAANAPLATNGKGKVVNLNADMVDGLDSSALKSPTYVFTQAVTVAATGVSLAIPLPAGNYIVSYSAYMSGAEGDNVGCYLRRDSSSDTFFGENRFLASTQTPGVTGSGFVNIAPPTSTLTLVCGATTAWDTFDAEPIQVVATRVDLAASGSLRVGGTSARAGR